MRPRNLILATLVLLVSACGQGQSPSALIAAVPDQVDQAGSSRFSLDLRMESPELPGGSGTVTAQGEVRYDPYLARATMDMGPLIPGAGDATMEVILDGSMMYLRMPQLEPMLPPGARWISTDLEAAGEQAGLDMGSLMQMGQSDPSQTLEMLRGVAEDEVEEVGTEEVRGVATTHYRATIEMERAIDRMPEESRDQFRDLMAQAGMPETVPVEVWIDGDGLPRRYVQSMTLTVPATGSTMEQTMTMELFDYGVEVDVERPPPDETVDASELDPPGNGP